ncbi:MAG: hypothetical protein ABIW76_00480 [Fibrobacteria bacterium]
MVHNRLKLSVLGFLIVGTVQTTWATYSRVESMGKRADFFMDDISIFDNPANMNIFPNFLIGELGVYRQGPGDTSAGIRRNIDPSNSWFGGIFSYSLSNNKESGNLYPQISLGGAFNRRDEELFVLLPDSVEGNVVPDPATNFDGFLGMTLSNGGMLGSHVYIAMQEGANLKNGVLTGAPDPDVNVYVLRGDLGLNWPIARNVDGEISFGMATISYGPKSIEPEVSYFVKGRAFSTLEIINGELVPIFNYSVLKAPGRDYTKLHFGIGVNVSLDRGFFWLGAQGLFDEDNKMDTRTSPSSGLVAFNPATTNTNTSEAIRGGLVSFGIERNVWWDWLVLRVGGQKEITYRDQTSTVPGNSFNFMYTNPTNDGSINDAVGFGIGINIEEKLKVDATLAEDLPYTFGNLFSGPIHHLVSRISATYSF